MDRSIEDISTPSISIEPLHSSIIRERDKEIVDFPAPVLPTMPIFEPGVTVKDNPLSTMSVFGLYLRCTSLNLI